MTSVKVKHNKVKIKSENWSIKYEEIQLKQQAKIQSLKTVRL